MWSEVTFSINKPTLSIFALIVDSARIHHYYFTIEVEQKKKQFSLKKKFEFLFFKVFCCLGIAYMCACAYYTMFRIRVFNYFYLSLYHLTDENSLVYAATFLSRLTAPLCYNFLGMIHMDQAITKETSRHQTVFTDVRFKITHLNLFAVRYVCVCVDYGTYDSDSNDFRWILYLFSDINLSVRHWNILSTWFEMFACVWLSTILRR